MRPTPNDESKRGTANPFFHRGPIRQAEHFYDREAETARALTLLGNLQNVAVIGQRRIGKTSFLFHLARPRTFVAAGLPKTTSVFAYVDGEELGALDAAEVYGCLARQLAAALPDGPHPETHPSALTHREFRQYVEHLTSQGFNLFLLLDEFEALAANPALTPRFFSGLRALSSQLGLAFVTASHRSLFDLTYGHADTLSSPFFNTFAHLKLGLFAEGAAADMIETLSRNAGSTLPRETVDRVVALAGPHPFLLQLAAFHAFEALDEVPGAGAPWEQRFEAEATPHFEYYWKHLSDEEQYALATLPFAREADSPVVRALEDAALVRRTPGGREYLSPILVRFVRRRAVRDLLQLGPFVLDLAGRRAVGTEGLLKVTKTEFDALAFMIRNAGRVISPQQVETALWGEAYIEDPERVRAVMKSLRKALGPDAECLATKWGEGYVLRIPA